MSERARKHYEERLEGSGLVLMARSVFRAPEGVRSDLEVHHNTSVHLHDKSSLRKLVRDILGPNVRDAESVVSKLGERATGSETMRHKPAGETLLAEVAQRMVPEKHKTGKLQHISVELLLPDELDALQKNTSSRLLHASEADRPVEDTEVFMLFGAELRTTLGTRLGAMSCAAVAFYEQNEWREGLGYVQSHVLGMRSAKAYERASYNASVQTARAIEFTNSMRPMEGGDSSGQ